MNSISVFKYKTVVIKVLVTGLMVLMGSVAGWGQQQGPQSQQQFNPTYGRMSMEGCDLNNINKANLACTQSKRDIATRLKSNPKAEISGDLQDACSLSNTASTYCNSGGANTATPQIMCQQAYDRYQTSQEKLSTACAQAKARANRKDDDKTVEQSNLAFGSYSGCLSQTTTCQEALNSETVSDDDDDDCPMPDGASATSWVKRCPQMLIGSLNEFKSRQSDFKSESRDAEDKVISARDKLQSLQERITKEQDATQKGTLTDQENAKKMQADLDDKLKNLDRNLEDERTKLESSLQQLEDERQQHVSDQENEDLKLRQAVDGIDNECYKSAEKVQSDQVNARNAADPNSLNKRGGINAATDQNRRDRDLANDVLKKCLQSSKRARAIKTLIQERINKQAQIARLDDSIFVKQQQINNQVQQLISRVDGDKQQAYKNMTTDMQSLQLRSAQALRRQAVVEMEHQREMMNMATDMQTYTQRKVEAERQERLNKACVQRLTKERLYSRGDRDSSEVIDGAYAAMGVYGSSLQTAQVRCGCTIDSSASDAMLTAASNGGVCKQLNDQMGAFTKAQKDAQDRLSGYRKSDSSQ